MGVAISSFSDRGFILDCSICSACAAWDDFNSNFHTLTCGQHWCVSFCGQHTAVCMSSRYQRHKIIDFWSVYLEIRGNIYYLVSNLQCWYIECLKVTAEIIVCSRECVCLGGGACCFSVAAWCSAPEIVLWATKLAGIWGILGKPSELTNALVPIWSFVSRTDITVAQTVLIYRHLTLVGGLTGKCNSLSILVSF